MNLVSDIHKDKIIIDFNLWTYNYLIKAFQIRDFSFQSFAGFIESPRSQSIILRHDVDKRKLYSLRFAELQAERGIRGTYYFRSVPQSWDERVIREIHEMGHEIGYHYECLTTANGVIDAAYDEFRRILERLRAIVPVTTICMHGSPMSRFDSRRIWEKYDYRALGITGEPYFDLDTSQVAYYTDTGRMWDGDRYSIRDRMEQPVAGNQMEVNHQMPGNQKAWPKYHSTFDIIKAIGEGTFPQRCMLTFHPQRWTNNPVAWTRELVWQEVKNRVKSVMVEKDVTRDT